jgi:CRP/FNR family transcriptional regulator, cyclic AMP receptor protein
VPGAAIDTLRRVPLFAELDEAELQSIADSMRERVFATGETVTVEGEAGDGFFVVDSGEAEVMAQGLAVGTVGAGDYVGEIALLMGADRTATITATSELRCYVLAPVDFRTLVEGNPTIAWKLLQSMQSLLS